MTTLSERLDGGGWTSAQGDAHLREKLAKSADRVASWVEERDYKGYDPGDGLNSFLRPLVRGNRLAERALLQLIWKSPVNLRPLVGVKPMESTKGRGYMAWGYLLRHKATGDAIDRVKAAGCLNWLVANKAPGHLGYSWGNHFDFITRSGMNPAGSPIIVWTSLIGQAFLEAYEQLGEDRYLNVARGICSWILKLPREQTATGTCLSYVPFRQSSIHNSNMLGAGMLASTWKHTREPELLEVAREAMRYSCSRQREDGSWWYGEDPKYHWIDSFHTGYNLDSLKRYLDSTGEDRFRANLQRGLHYFKNVFFDSDGRPRYYHTKTYPIDIQCASQAIDTLASCSEEDRTCLETSVRVANWTIDNMQDRTGYFYYRKYPVLTAKTPYIHWGQATMFKALANLSSRLASRTA